jgi:hypothetical protein
LPDPRTRVRHLVLGSFGPHRVCIGPLAFLFLFCSNRTWRLCQAEISVRQALATHTDVSGWSSRDIRERYSQEQSGLRRMSVGAGLKPAPTAAHARMKQSWSGRGCSTSDTRSRASSEPQLRMAGHPRRIPPIGLSMLGASPSAQLAASASRSEVLKAR